MPRVSLKSVQARLRQPTASVSVLPFVGTLQSEGGAANSAAASALVALEDSVNSILAQFRSLAETTGVDNRFSIDGEHINHLRASKIDTDDLTIGGSGINANVIGLAADDHVMLWAGKYGSDYGLWSEILRAGGTSFGTASFRASATGLQLDNSLISLVDSGTGNSIIISPTFMVIDMYDAVNDTSLQLSTDGLEVIHIVSDDSSPSSSYEIVVTSFPETAIDFYYGGDRLMRLGGSIGGIFPHLVIFDSGGNERARVYDGTFDGYQWKLLDALGVTRTQIGAYNPSIILESSTIDIHNMTSTSATAGTASSLPATPEGYLEFYIDGTSRKIPYYRS